MSRTLVPFALLIVLGLCLLTPSVQSMPNFARKYEMACNDCHTTIPRLNEMGYAFRKAGFRMPAEIGEAAKTSLQDAFAARIQVRYDVKHHSDPQPSGTVSSTTNQLTFHEVTLYPLSGSFGKHYGSMTELSLANEDFFEIENAYFRYATGTENSFFSGRIGIFHPFEGYGGSDRPFSISRPFIQTRPANQNGSTFFTPWNFDEAGLELAYVMNKTTFSGTLFNGLVLKDDEGSFKAFPAAGGELQKNTGFDGENSKDIQLFINHILKGDGSGLSVYFYRGTLDVPIPGTDPADFDPTTSFANDFYRVAGYGSWSLTKQLLVQAGYQWGQDHFYDAAAGNADDTFNSQGWFGEVDAPIQEHLTVGGRFDWFDPSTDVDNNIQQGVTLFANVPLNDGFQGMAEYQHLQRDRAGLDNLKDDNVQARIIWIW